MKLIISLAAAILLVGLSVLPAAADSVVACKLAGRSWSNAHCCPKGQVWGTVGSVQECFQPTLGVDDPRDNSNGVNIIIARCKALHTC